jgi:hypothetical protein
VIAYKFLSSGGVGPFSRYAWPLPRDGRPGAWVSGATGAVLCRSAVHACRVRDLPWWLQDELWEAELDGEIATGRHKVMAPRARLLRRVEPWDAACSQRFADACAMRARDHAVTALQRAGAKHAAAQLRKATDTRSLRDAARIWADAATPSRIPVMMAGDAARRARGGAAVVAGYIAAKTAARVDGPAALDAEREWQADWLHTTLSLSA